MNTCVVCGLEALPGKRYRCREHYREYQRQWYEANKDKHKARTDRRRKKYRQKSQQLILEHLTKNPCVDCGEKDPLCLHFDHVRGEKIMEISRMINRQTPIPVLLDEVAKCEVRCANCHQRRTARVSGWWKTQAGDAQLVEHLFRTQE